MEYTSEGVILCWKTSQQATLKTNYLLQKKCQVSDLSGLILWTEMSSS